MKKITDMALDWHSEGMTDKQVVDNVADDIMNEIIDKYDLDLNEPQIAKLEMLLCEITSDNIEWDLLDDADKEVAAYEDAKRSAIYK